MKKSGLWFVFLLGAYLYGAEITDLVLWSDDKSGDPAQTEFLTEHQEKMEHASTLGSTDPRQLFSIPSPKALLRKQYELHKMFAEAGIGREEQIRICRLLLEDYLLKFIGNTPQYPVYIRGVSPDELTQMLPREGFPAGSVKDRTVYEISFLNLHRETEWSWTVTIHSFLDVKNWSRNGGFTRQYRITRKNPALTPGRVEKKYTEAMAATVRKNSRNSLRKQFEYYGFCREDQNKIIESIFARLMKYNELFSKPARTTIAVRGLPYEDAVAIKLPPKIEWAADPEKADRTLWFDQPRPRSGDGEDGWTFPCGTELIKVEAREAPKYGTLPDDIPGFHDPEFPRWREQADSYNLKRTDGRWSITSTGSEGTYPYVILEKCGIGFTDRLTIVDRLLNDFLPRFFPPSDVRGVRFKGIPREEFELIALPSPFRIARPDESDCYQVEIRDMTKGGDGSLYIHLMGRLYPAGISRYIVYRVRKEAGAWKLVEAKLLDPFPFL